MNSRNLNPLPLPDKTDSIMDEIADLIIDSFLASRKLSENKKQCYTNNELKHSLRDFNGRLGQIRKGLSSPGRPL